MTPNHSPNESAIGQTKNGKLFYQCFHNSCEGKTWKEARKIISGDDKIMSSNDVEDLTSPYNLKIRDDFNQQIEEAKKDVDKLLTIAMNLEEKQLPETHKVPLFKKIAKKSKVPLKTLRSDLKKDSYESNESQHFAAARDTIEEIGEENIKYGQGGFWEWKGNGVWEPMNDREMNKKIHDSIDPTKITKNTVNSILDIIKTERFKSDLQFDKNCRDINCFNGELHLEKGQWVLNHAKRENYRITQIPLIYSKKSKAPRFMEFLNEIFENDPEIENKVQLVLEMMGYCLLSTTEFERFFILIGPGANGKSVLMDILASLIGSKNVCAVQPDQFENKFQRAHLHGKLLNLVTELPIGSKMADAQLKAISSGELSTAENKFSDPFDFRPYATCVFGTNHLPHTRDFSDALSRRAIIIPFNRVFAVEEQDRRLKEKLCEELPGILNLALEGLNRLFQQQDFTDIQEVVEAKLEWQLECDQAAQFVDEECLIGQDLEIKSSSLFQAYEFWARDAGIKKTLGRKNFTSRLRRFGVIPKRGAHGVRMLNGVDIKECSQYSMIYDTEIKVISENN